MFTWAQNKPVFIDQSGFKAFQARESPFEKGVQKVLKEEIPGLKEADGFKVPYSSLIRLQQLSILPEQAASLSRQVFSEGSYISLKHSYTPQYQFLDTGILHSGQAEDLSVLKLGGVLGAPEPYGTSPYHELNFSYALNIPFERKGLHLGFIPKFKVRFKNQGIESTRFGGIIRFSKNLKRKRHKTIPPWYFFVGVDTQALTYTYDGSWSLKDALRLEDRTIFGDIQAGFAYRIGKAHLSLTYFTRSSSVEDYKFRDNMLALTFSLKR